MPDKTRQTPEGSQNLTTGQNRNQHILACITPTPVSEEVILTARRIADVYGGQLTAATIESSSYSQLRLSSKRDLKRYSLMAKSVGASLETLQGDDIAYMIAEFCKLAGVTQIVVSRESFSRSRSIYNSVLFKKLQRLLPDVELHFIPTHAYSAISKIRPFSLNPGRKTTALDYAKMAAILAITTAVALVLDLNGFDDSAITPIYTLAVMGLAMIVPDPVVIITGTLITIFLFNFLFAKPLYSFSTTNPTHYLVYTVMFCCSLSVGFLASSLKKSSIQSGQAAYRQKILFDTNEMLQSAASGEDIVMILGKQVRRLAHRNTLFFGWDGTSLQEPLEFPLYETKPVDKKKLEQWKDVIVWSASHLEEAGTPISRYPDCPFLLLPCKNKKELFGVIAIEMDHDVLESLEYSILRAILSKGAISWSNMILDAKAKEAERRYQNEAVRSTLLKAISHDLRTPLTVIQGNLSNLMADPQADEHMQHQFKDSYDNTVWLIAMVENLLTASRLEEGTIPITPTPELLEDLAGESIAQIHSSNPDRTIVFNPDPDIIMVSADSPLIVQVINNILHNAIEYSPADTPVAVTLFEEDGMGVLQVCDEGPGVRQEDKNFIFDMFYSGNKVVADSRRSMGLGLFLCRKIMDAHKGVITYRERKPHGSCFEIRLPLADLSGIRDSVGEPNGK